VQGEEEPCDADVASLLKYTSVPHMVSSITCPSSDTYTPTPSFTCTPTLSFLSPPPRLGGYEYKTYQGATDVRPAARGTEEMFGCVVKSVEIGMNTRLLRPCTAYHTTYEHVGVPVCWPIECPFIVHDYGLHVSLLSVIHLYLSLLSVTLIHLFTCLSLLSLSHIVLSLLQEPRHSERRRIPAHTVREKGGLWSHCTRPCMGLLVQESSESTAWGY
jgi:hypothetical protein